MASGKGLINIANKYDRVIVLVDMDCFYCQVEEKLNPLLAGKPIAVVQYNAWRGGGIIAVNYPARAMGVTRHMRGDEAREQCPSIELVRVPSVREKADLTKYRTAGKKVAEVLQTFTSLLERASVDEAYLDITEQVVARLNTMDKGGFPIKPTELVNTYAVGYDFIGSYIQEITSRMEADTDGDNFDCDEIEANAIRKSDLKLLLGASIVSEIRAKVKEQTGYDCSAGIAHNKILAKLACGINKPNKQTILPLQQINLLFSALPVGKITGLGGKFGEDICAKLGIKFLGDLISFSEKELQRKFDEKNGSWLYLIARGIDLEAVTPRYYSKSIGCCKKFPGRSAITGLNTLVHWFEELAKEICNRLESDIIENNRRAKQMVVSFIQEINGEDVSSSRSTSLLGYDSEMIAKNALETLKKNTDQFYKPNNEGLLNNSIKFLGISVGKFETLDTNKNTLQQMFLNQAKKKSEQINSIPIVPSQTSNGLASCVETTKTEIEIPVKKGFFAAHMKKHSEASVLNESSKVDIIPSCHQEKKENPAEIKSFFLNAIKKKSIEKDELTLRMSDDQDSNDSIQINFEENVKRSKVLENKLEDILSTSNCDPSSSHINQPPETSYQHNESNISTNDFTRNYAEFLVPEPNPDDYIRCEKCGKSILSYAMDTHLDFHFAFELSQEQRNQFRNEFKAKIISPPVKKLKLNNNSSISSKSKPSVGTSIDKFLIKRSPSDVHSLRDVEDKQRCTECGSLVDVSKILEHMDFHTAKKLQLELNRPQRNGSNLESVGIDKSSAKKNVKTDSTKDIKAFFVPKV